MVKKSIISNQCHFLFVDLGHAKFDLDGFISVRKLSSVTFFGCF